MHIEIDISEHLRHVEKISVLGFSTIDGKVKKNISLVPKEKKRIIEFSGKIPKIHAIMIYLLIKEDIYIQFHQ